MTDGLLLTLLGAAIWGALLVWKYCQRYADASPFERSYLERWKDVWNAEIER